MNKIPQFLPLTMLAVSLVIVLLTACTGIPIAVPEDVEPAAQATIIPQATLIATPVSEDTAEQI